LYGNSGMEDRGLYRNLINYDNLVSFRVIVKETDLLIQAERDLSDNARELVLECRGHLESYIEQYQKFALTLTPWKKTGPAPKIVREMILAGEAAGVGPMAAVAGAVAEIVGRELLKYSENIVVENGGDIFYRLDNRITAGIFAGPSPLSMKVGITVDGCGGPVSLCTSSGTVGHSRSFGSADAVCVVSDSCALADAAATSVANRILSKNDIAGAIEFGRSIKGVKGIVGIKEDGIGVWGDIEIVPLEGSGAKRKKG
jgi:uncharacterized protein